jgi:hypothetical protein
MVQACKQNVNFPPILDLHHSQGVLQRNTSARVGTPPRFKPSGRTRWRRHISGDSREQQRFARGAAGALPGNLFAVLPPASWRAEGGIERRPIAGGRQQASWSFGGRLLRYRPVLPHSHSMVAGGLPEMSYTTRLMPRTSLMMRLETLPSKLCGSSAQWAVMKSCVCTARRATTYS